MNGHRSSRQITSFLNTAESNTRAFDVPSWVVLVEASTPQAAAAVRVLIDASARQDFGVSIRADAATYTLEISRLAQPAGAA